MACHYRLAHKSAWLGMPEITLGLIPGAGGTQRLPRLIGAKPALDMILSGRSISAADALSCGLVDEIVEGNISTTALDFCERVVRDGRGPRPTSDCTVLTGLAEDEITEAFRAHARALKGRTTQHLVAQAIKASALPFAEGLAVEAELAQKSLASRESQALRHLFFAERETSKIPGLIKQAHPSEIKKVAVIGAGTMGSGIATAFANAGVYVALIDNSPLALARSQKIIHSTYAADVKRGRITQELADQRTSRITTGVALDDAADTDMVLEAVFEDMELKKEILSTLDSVVAPERLIATNTSTLSLTELARSTAHPGRVLGMHFFVPAHVSKLLEIVRSDQSSPEALTTALQIAKLLRKVPVVARDAFGFIGNRMMLDGYFREAEQLMLEGASPMQIDAALEEFGFAMGPQRVSDLGGNDVGTKVRIQLFKRERRPDPYFAIADRLTELGWLGQKTSRGFYRYRDGSREALPDPEVIALIGHLAAERGIARREIGADEIVERCTLSLINVGAMVLEEGIAARAADIDVVWTNGYGFPRHLGGAMFYADTLGIAHVADRIRYYHKQLGYYWRPSALIERLAAEGSSFSDWERTSSQTV
jgi:3-hydroxyacyl-CoA dehydrogenase